jgi:hypothetical protein
VLSGRFLDLLSRLRLFLHSTFDRPHDSIRCYVHSWSPEAPRRRPSALPRTSLAQISNAQLLTYEEAETGEFSSSAENTSQVDAKMTNQMPIKEIECLSTVYYSVSSFWSIGSGKDWWWFTQYEMWPPSFLITSSSRLGIESTSLFTRDSSMPSHAVMIT